MDVLNYRRIHFLTYIILALFCHTSLASSEDGAKTKANIVNQSSRNKISSRNIISFQSAGYSVLGLGLHRILNSQWMIGASYGQGNKEISQSSGGDLSQDKYVEDRTVVDFQNIQMDLSWFPASHRVHKSGIFSVSSFGQQVKVVRYNYDRYGPNNAFIKLFGDKTRLESDSGEQTITSPYFKQMFNYQYVIESGAGALIDNVHFVIGAGYQFQNDSNIVLKTTKDREVTADLKQTSGAILEASVRLRF